VIGNVVKVMRIATREIEDTIPDDGKDPAAEDICRRARFGLSRNNLISDTHWPYLSQTPRELGRGVRFGRLSLAASGPNTRAK
jgi:hypothetical protein